MSAALQGIDHLFYIPSHSQHRAHQFAKVVQVAKVSLIVLVSLLGCESRAGVFCSQFRDMEELLEQSGIPFVILQCAPFQVS